MHLQRQLEGVEFTSEGSEKDEHVLSKKKKLQNELEGVQAELAEINSRYEELKKQSKEAATGDLPVKGPEAYPELKATPPESSPLGLSAPEGDAKVSAVPNPEPLEMESQGSTATMTKVEALPGA